MLTLKSSGALDVALEMTRAALGLADDFANGLIAKQIVELARAGEENPDVLCEGALKALRGHLFGDWVKRPGPACSVRDCVRPSFPRPKGAPWRSRQRPRAGWETVPGSDCRPRKLRSRPSQCVPRSRLPLVRQQKSERN